MVGDVKQSIYKFRQARPDLFLSKYKTYKLKQNKTENGTDSTSKKEDEGSKGNDTQDGGNK